VATDSCGREKEEEKKEETEAGEEEEEEEEEESLFREEEKGLFNANAGNEEYSNSKDSDEEEEEEEEEGLFKADEGGGGKRERELARTGEDVTLPRNARPVSIEEARRTLVITVVCWRVGVCIYVHVRVCVASARDGERDRGGGWAS